MKEQNIINLFFSYLPTQPKKYRVGVQQTNTFFKDGLIDSFSCKHADNFQGLTLRERFGSAPIYVFARHVVSTILQSNEMSGG